MEQRVLAIKIDRLKMGVGAKTLLALSVCFWVPISVLAGILFLLFQDLFVDEATAQIKLGLKGAKTVYEERPTVLKQLVPAFARRPDVQDAFFMKDPARLQNLLLEFGKETGFVTVLAAVDENQRIIARRGGSQGEIVSIGDILSRAVLQDELTSATELVSREFLLQESLQPADFIKDVGVVQFVVAPVKREGRIVGAVLTGVLLTADPWLGDTIYKNLGMDFTLFAGKPAEGASIHATASEPKNQWVLGQAMPGNLSEDVLVGRPHYGVMDVNGVPVVAAFEPIKDSRNRVIGAMSVSVPAKEFNSLIMLTVGKGLGVAALLGLVISLVVTFFIRNDITAPLNLLVEGMTRFGKGDLGISVDIQTGDQFEKLGAGFNDMARGIVQREERLKKHNMVAKLLMSTINLSELLDQTLRIVVEITESQLGVIYLWEEESEELVSYAQYGMSGDLPRLKLGVGYPGQAAKERKKLITPVAANIPEGRIEMGITQCISREVAYVPLVYQDRCLGVLAVGSVEKYKDEVVQLFDYLADQIAIALDNAVMHQRVQELSVTDGLTKLYNRRFMNNRLEELWARAVRHSEPLSIILSDVDNFKSINDTYGHDRGDEVLREVARIFKETARKEDLVARYGGEEFLIVMANTETQEAVELANRIGEMARRKVYPWADRKVTLSLGVATYPAVTASSFDDLVRYADQAMYKAKVSGKDKTVVFSADAAA